MVDDIIIFQQNMYKSLKEGKHLADSLSEELNLLYTLPKDFTRDAVVAAHRRGAHVPIREWHSALGEILDEFEGIVKDDD